MEIEKDHLTTSVAEAPKENRESTLPTEVLWLSLAAWGIAFFLPAARYEDWGAEKMWFGWEAAYGALVLLVIPVKGMWFGFVPHVFSVLVNFFMLLAPFKINAVRLGKGRVFATLFMIATAIPVCLLAIPEKMDLAQIRDYLIGFDLWALSMIVASSWFAWAVWRKWFALVPGSFLAAALVCGLFLWSPFLQGPTRQARKKSAEQAKLRLSTDPRTLEKALAQHGLEAFEEPLNDQQGAALKSYIRAHDFTPEELIAAGRRYYNPAFVSAVSARPNCPVQVLEILFTNTADHERSGPYTSIYLQEAYSTIARHSNTTLELLLEMLQSKSPFARAAALRTGRLPLKQKEEYLKRGCSFSVGDELDAVAKDPDTPVSVLECLSDKSDAEYGLAANPNTPISVLEKMSHSTNFQIAAVAHQRLLRLQQNK